MKHPGHTYGGFISAISKRGMTAELVFEKDVVLIQRKVWKNGKIGLTQMDKNNDLKDRIQVQRNKFDFVVIEEVVKKLTSWKTKLVLEARGDNNSFVDIRCGDIFCDVPALKKDD
jgi:hypothetical protein